MKEFLVRQLQFIIMLIVWLIAGQVAKEAAMLVVVLSLMLLRQRNMTSEMMLGFIFILILSDSYEPVFAFASDLKVIYLVVLTGFFLIDRKSFKFRNPYLIPMIPFLIWAFVVMFRSPDIPTAFQKTLSYAILYAIMPIYFVKAFREKGSVFIKDFIYMGTILLIIGLVLINIDYDFVYIGGRYNGIFGNPNGIGLFSALFFILVYCSHVKFPDLLKKHELIIIYSLISISVILSGSRNSLMCILIFLGFAKFYKISYWYGFITVIVAILLYQVVFVNLPTILEMLGLSEALRADSIEEGSGRIVAWGFAINLLKNDTYLFLFGNGFYFESIIFGIYMNYLISLGHIGGVHNTYLALWLNTGIIGLILWLWGFLRLFFKVAATNFTALPILYAVLFSAFFETWLMASLNPFHITVILILSLLFTNNEDFADNKIINANSSTN